MAAPETAAERLAGIVPDAVVEVLDHLHASGHAGYVVGGSLRDALLGRDPADWDLATDALPDQLVEAVPRCRLREPVRDRCHPP